MITIGKVSRLMDVSTGTLRYYEREGLISPSGKSESGYRLYEQDDVRRVRFIKHAQRCGFTLAEISRLLALRGKQSACCHDVRTLALEKKLRLEAKIKAMKKMSQELDRLMADCSNDELPIDSCSILTALDQATSVEKDRGQ